MTEKEEKTIKKLYKCPLCDYQNTDERIVALHLFRRIFCSEHIKKLNLKEGSG